MQILKTKSKKSTKPTVVTCNNSNSTQTLSYTNSYKSSNSSGKKKVTNKSIIKLSKPPPFNLEHAIKVQKQYAKAFASMPLFVKKLEQQEIDGIKRKQKIAEKKSKKLENVEMVNKVEKSVTKVKVDVLLHAQPKPVRQVGYSVSIS